LPSSYFFILRPRSPSRVATCFVHQGDDVAPVVEAAGRLTKLEDRSDEDLSRVLRQELLQLFASVATSAYAQPVL
jgi:hypothetical protein